MVEQTRNEALGLLVDWAGSMQALAHEARVSESSIRSWLAQGRVPATAARLLAELVQGDLDNFDDAEMLEAALRGR